MGSNIKGRGDTPIRFGVPAFKVGELLMRPNGSIVKVLIDCERLRLAGAVAAYVLEDRIGGLYALSQDEVETAFVYAGRFAA